MTYLAELTQLELLRSLEVFDNPKTGPPIHTTLLSSTVNLKHLRIWHVSQALLDFIELLHQVSSAGRLTSLSFHSRQVSESSDS